MHTALEIAQYIINKCINSGKPVSNLQLQKILYYVQGEYMKENNGEPLFEDDIVAWQYGPVVSEVYYHYNIYSSSAITSEQNYIELTEEEKNIINPIINKKSNLSAWRLVQDTHSEDPWKKTYRDGEKNKITKDTLRKFFMQ